MRLLKNGKVFWNLTKNAAKLNQTSDVLVKLLPASYSSKPDGGSKQKLLPYHVLPLEETIDRFLLTVQPLLSSSEFEEQCKITKDFQDHEGEELQQLLEEVGCKEKNWLAHRWLKVAYLQYRDPVTVFISPGMTFPVQSFCNKSDFLNYTARVIFGLGEFKNIVDAGKIPVVKMGKNELDNSQFGKVFGTCRIPIRITDEIVYNPKSKHVVIIYKNHFYKLDIYDDCNKLLSAPTIAQQLCEIVEAESEFGTPYGILTTDSRDNWAEAYENLVKNPKNCKALEGIQSALFTVSLDQYVNFKPEDEANQLISSLIHGNGSKVNSGNRWMDKTIQLVVNPNGLVGFTYEHSPAEGQPIAMMMDYVVKKMCEDEQFGESGSTKARKLEKLSFAPLNPCIEQWCVTASRNVDKLAKTLDVHVLKYKNYGKDYIKNKRLGPDSYVQMAIQLAYYSMHHKPAAQYESAHLRIFENGRTETIRSCSNESVAFCKAMVDDSVSIEEKATLLRKAVSGHQAYTKLALQGRGVDRHLLGLKLMALENNKPVPKFFSSLGYTESQTFRMSTSQVATVYDAFMGYGPATEDGYGVCYNPRECDVILAISAWKTSVETSPQRLAKALTSAFNNMKKVMDAEPAKPAKSKL